MNIKTEYLNALESFNDRLESQGQVASLALNKRNYRNQKETTICREIHSIGGIGWNRIRFAMVSFARLKEI